MLFHYLNLTKLRPYDEGPVQVMVLCLNGHVV